MMCAVDPHLSKRSKRINIRPYRLGMEKVPWETMRDADRNKMQT